MSISDWSSDVCSSDRRNAVLEDEHSMFADHDQPLFLERMQPARGDVPRDAGRKTHMADAPVGDAGRDVRRALCGNGRRRLVYESQNHREIGRAWCGKSVSVRVDLGGRRNLKKK